MINYIMLNKPTLLQKKKTLVIFKCNHVPLIFNPNHISYPYSRYTSLLTSNSSLFFKKTNIISLISQYKYVNDVTLLNNWILRKYLNNISLSYTGFNLCWNFINLNFFLQKASFLILWRKLYNKKLLQTLYSRRLHFLRWFIKLHYLKDPQDLIIIIKQSFFKVFLKKHKKVYYLINKFLKIWYSFAIKTKTVKGYSLFFKGKLAKRGSVRKNILFFKKGQTSFTNKQLRVTIRHFIIWTVTGSVGACINIFYKRYVYTNLFIYSFLFN